MHWIDWTIVVGLITFITIAAWFTKRYTRSVSDFLAANRCAGRYMLGVAEGMAMVGAISFIAFFEVYHKIGFVGIWWQYMWAPAGLIITLTGWVIYRFRETHALTMGQFFEIRYSKRFRIFAGILAFFAGIINFGIFPAVGARFFLYFTGMPETIYVFGVGLSTYVTLIVFLLTISTAFAFMGGQIAIMVTDFFQWIFCNITFLAIVIFLLITFKWSSIMEALSFAPSGESMINPFKTEKANDFNVWFFMITIFGMFYNCLAWQGSQGYNSAAKSPHEARMGRVVGGLRMGAMTLALVLIPVCAYVLIHSNASVAESVQNVLAGIENPQIKAQVKVPVILRHMLPIGLAGAFCASMFAAFVSTHDTCLHSWGSIFVQDILVPIRKKPFTAKQHLWLLRASIVGVAIFIFCFSLLFKQNQYLLMYSALTGAIWLGGAGSIIIGGLYWKRGTATAAWYSLIIGAVLAVASLVIRQLPELSVNESVPLFLLFKNLLIFLKQNGQLISFYTMLTCIIVYIIVSLLTCKKPFNLDQMLHRGKYASEEDSVSLKKETVRSGWRKVFHLGKEFTRGDKIIYSVVMVSSLGWFAVFVIGCIYNFMYGVPDQTWKTFWRIQTLVLLALAVIFTIWLSLGGIKDLLDMVKILRTKKRDSLDDGTVIDHKNLDETKKLN